jgi:hypothetical protein
LNGFTQRAPLASNEGFCLALWIEAGTKIGRPLGTGVLDTAQIGTVDLNPDIVAQTTASGADQALRAQLKTSLNIADITCMPDDLFRTFTISCRLNDLSNEILTW